jgi:biotin synthase
MCYTIPGKVEVIKDRTVTVNYFGEKKQAYNDFFQLSPGDYIYAQGGYVVQKVSPREAAEVLQAWQELFFELKELDAKLANLNFKSKVRDKDLTGLLNDILTGQALSEEKALYLLRLTDPQQQEMIFQAANYLRQKYQGNSSCIHGIIEISNYCRRNCRYCGISAFNQQLKRYRLTREEILAVAAEAVHKYGFKAILLQSGEDPGYSLQELTEIIAEIRAKLPVLIFISFGEIGLAGLEQLYQAGARGLLLRFETSNPRLYAELHPGYDLASRLEHIRKACEIGYLVMTGGLIGLPGQTEEDIIKDLFLARDLKAEMFSFGPFIPHPQTPLADSFKPGEELMLKAIAIARLIDPQQAKILITTGFETISGQARKRGFLAGANSLMVNLTPVRYRRLYNIYPHRAHDEEEISNQIDEAVALLKSIGRAPTDLGVKI